MKTYRAAVIGCSRMGAFIDNEVPDYQAIPLPYSHAAGFYAEERTDLVACSDLRPDVMEVFGERYDVPKERQYTDYRELIDKENLDIASVANTAGTPCRSCYPRCGAWSQGNLRGKGDGGFDG